jgi:site-specific recombinase XerD
MLPRVLLSLQDVEQVLAVPDVTTAVGLRDRAMMEVLFSTGIRRMELAGLTLVDLDLPRRLLLVRRGKGRKDRMLPLGERAGRWVQRYLASARPLLLRGADDGWLFPGHGGRALSLQWGFSDRCPARARRADRQARQLPPHAPRHGHADARRRCGRECPNFCVRGGLLN